MSALPSRSYPMMGSWEKIYWEKGAEAAELYCKGKSTRWKNAEITIQQLVNQNDFVLNQQLMWLQSSYFGKKERYQEEKICKSGIRERDLDKRGQPGRTPFHRPSFRKRFEKIEDLKRYVVEKKIYHSRCLGVLTKAEQTLRLSLPQHQELAKLKQYHSKAVYKWQNVRTDRVDLLPITKKKPLEVMKITHAHAKGAKGARGCATIFGESRVDHTHIALRDCYLSSEFTKTTKKWSDHGTHVCGIIAMTAPSGKITSYEVDAHPSWRPPLKGIINWSGSLSPKEASDFWNEEKISAWYFKHFPPTDDRLVIQACGNDAIVVDRDLQELRMHPVLSEPSRRERWIFVVNLEQNGLYPNKGSNLPGKSFAKMAISAIGTNIRSSIRGDAFAKKSGTSMATPFVTGVAMMIQGAFPLLNLDEVSHSLLHGATPIMIDQYGIPHFVRRDQLALYSEKEISKSQEVFGMGLLNAEESMRVAARLMDIKLKMLAAQRERSRDIFEKVWEPPVSIESH